MTVAAHDALIRSDENRRMFDRIARRYDLLNAIMSFGLHRIWRCRAVDSLCAANHTMPGRDFLDIGCGTGDLALAVLRENPAAMVTGIDLSNPMLAIAARKTTLAGLADRASYQAGDATAMVFGDRTFDGIVSAFCLRNIDDRAKAFQEMRRVLRPGGRLVILELNKPAGLLPGLAHRFHTRRLIPFLGTLLSQGQAYRYLADSIEHFPPPATIVDELVQAGFVQARQTPLTGGFVTLFSALAPRPLSFAAPVYANAVPLTQFIPATSPGARVLLGTPAELVAPLLNGQVDAALLPVAAVFANPELMPLEGTGICAGKEVRSVLLKCRKPLAEVRTVRLDPASRTSNVLAQILLKEYWKLPVRYLKGNDEVADAEVVIGDRALCEAQAAGGDFDLAAAWHTMTGLPFVFAVWTVRCDQPAKPELIKVIEAAKQAGTAAIPGIARQEALKLGLSETVCLEYFTSCISYDIGPAERQGMELFRQLVQDMTPNQLCVTALKTPPSHMREKY